MSGRDKENRYCPWCKGTVPHSLKWEGELTFTCCRCGSVKRLVGGKEVACHMSTIPIGPIIASSGGR